MAKIPQKYFNVDPWAIIEEGFDPAKARISESVFSLANEYMGVRGYFDEGYTGDHLVGSYINGLYEVMDIQHPQLFKGFVTRRAFNVNSVDWLYTRIILDGEQLDLAVCKFADFVRRFDLKTNTITRQFVWHTNTGKQLKLVFTRFLSITNRNLACQRITFEPLNFSGEIGITCGLDFSPPHEIASGWSQVKKAGQNQQGKNFWTCTRKEKADNIFALLGRTESTGQWLFSSFRLDGASLTDATSLEDQKFIGIKGNLELRQAQPTSVDKIVVNRWQRDNKVTADDAWDASLALAKSFESTTFDGVWAAHCDYWTQKWQVMDITIDGDEEMQQGVRFSISQLYQTYQGNDPSINVPCKGLTAEVYYGWMFWDTETYCLPFYMFSEPKAARALLQYRYIYLPQAIERAEQLGCRGARFPFATIDGNECCGTWQHCDLEIHVDAAVSYGIWHYVKVCGDTDFLYREGIEILMQICRFFASRGQWGRQTGLFGFFGVMGPDEFHTMVNNNCYTNYMARKTFEYTLSVVAEMKREAPELLQAVTKKVNLEPAELDDWKRMAEKMCILYDKKTGLYEQHDGYFNLPHVDVQNIPPDQIPIYANWVYEKIFRCNMLKQPDFLLLPLFFSEDFTPKQKRTNYEFYEARTIHESSLSPSIHSILAAELGKLNQAYDFFRYTARLDLDNYNRNTEQGLHTTAMSGVWLSIVYGFAGMRTDGPLLSFNPSIPAEWNSYTFRILYKDALIEVNVDTQSASFRTISGPEVAVKVYAKQHHVNNKAITVKIKNGK